MNTDIGGVTITNTEKDPWDTDILLFLPDGASPVIPESTMMDIYTAMVIEERFKDRDFSDKEALNRCKADVQTAITYVLGWIKAAERPGLDEERKHRLTMIGIRGMPTEMLDRKYNLYRMENQGINLDDHPEYRSYQAFYEMGIEPPTHPGNGGHNHCESWSTIMLLEKVQ